MSDQFQTGGAGDSELRQRLQSLSTFDDFESTNGRRSWLREFLVVSAWQNLAIPGAEYPLRSS